MGYDDGDSFPFDFEPNGIPFDSKSKGKLSPRWKWKFSFLSVDTCYATARMNSKLEKRHISPDAISP